MVEGQLEAVQDSRVLLLSRVIPREGRFDTHQDPSAALMRRIELEQRDLLVLEERVFDRWRTAGASALLFGVGGMVVKRAFFGESRGSRLDRPTNGAPMSITPGGH